MPKHPQHQPVYITFAAVAWAMGSPLQGLQRLALIELARHADAGGRCWPSMRTIASRLGTSVRWARSTIAQLERDGYVSRAQIAGKGAIFQLHMSPPTPFDTPELEFRGAPETPEPQFRPPRNGSSGAPRNPSSAKQRASSNENMKRVSNRNGANSRAGSGSKNIRNEQRYANVRMFNIAKKLWADHKFGPITADEITPAKAKARCCALIEACLDHGEEWHIEDDLRRYIQRFNADPYERPLDEALATILQEARKKYG